MFEYFGRYASLVKSAGVWASVVSVMTCLGDWSVQKTFNAIWQRLITCVLILFLRKCFWSRFGEATVGLPLADLSLEISNPIGLRRKPLKPPFWSRLWGHMNLYFQVKGLHSKWPADLCSVEQRLRCRRGIAAMSLKGRTVIMRLVNREVSIICCTTL